MIYVTGDTHGDIERFKSREMKKLGSGDTLIICGDFGFLWDDSRAERNALKKLASKDYTIAFVDGCHELMETTKTLICSKVCLSPNGTAERFTVSRQILFILCADKFSP